MSSSLNRPSRTSETPESPQKVSNKDPATKFTKKDIDEPSITAGKKRNAIADAESKPPSNKRKSKRKETKVEYAARKKQEQLENLRDCYLETLSDDDFHFSTMPEQTEYNYGDAGSMEFMENYHGKDYWD